MNIKVKQILCLSLLFGCLFNSWAINPTNKSLLSGIAIKGYDPVAYFTKGKATKGSRSYTFKWQDATWQFATLDNLKRFKSAPEKFAPQYGGYCAYAVSQGGTANIDPTQFTVLHDKLYLNYNQSINKKWSENRDVYIKEANLEWPRLLKK